MTWGPVASPTAGNTAGLRKGLPQEPVMQMPKILVLVIPEIFRGKAL